MVRRGVGQILFVKEADVCVVVGVDFPEDAWEVAVFGAREILAARTPLHSGFEAVGGPGADLGRVFAVASLVEPVEGVLVDAGLQGGWLDFWMGGWLGSVG